MARRRKTVPLKTAVRTRTEKAGRVENIIAYQFKPGESGNPGGRPRKVLSDLTRADDQSSP